ncbi:MAG: tryptophan synthase subunit alpha [Deltaproteobacteria bacterium]|nr:tryptophan synthase subunit alpha [Deltaproteobacteria bacterium]
MSRPPANRFPATFAALREHDEAAFVPFLMAGDGGIDTTERLLDAVVEAGADVIELGVPFSDPMADGPALQRAAERALKAGTTLTGVLDLVARFRKRSEVPIVLFGYANPFLAFGAEGLAQAASGVGVDGLLCVDMPPDEADQLRLPLRRSGIDMIFLLAPTSTAERIDRVLGVASGFVYFVSVAGTTGVKAADTEAIAGLVARIRARTPLPVGIGFGITRTEQATAVAQMADAVVVGTEISRRIEAASDRADAVAQVGSLARDMKRATHRSGRGR